MFYELAQNYNAPLYSLSLYPPACDRNAWTSLDENWKKEALRLGQFYLHYPYPKILASDFMDFSITGNRTRYEDKYFARRRALDALVLAECAADQNAFITDIINGIFCICEESGWQLPPHNSYIRDSIQFPLPDSSEPVLDLFACETGSILAATAYLLKEKLDAVSPFICKRIYYELNARIFTPYLERHFWWMGDGQSSMNNWTIWCTQNVLLSVFLTENTDQRIRRSVFQKACESVDYFLAEYGEDGCCDEGALYYRHAGLCLFNTLEILNAITDNHFLGLYQNNKIRNIASYIMNVHIHDKYYVNFADCSPVAGRCGAREFLFAKRTDNENMMYFAAKDFSRGLPDTLCLPSESNLYYRLQNAFTIKEIASFMQEKHSDINYPNMYYPSVGLFIARDKVYFLAVKAGDNGDSHNHNDTGSFIIYKDGLPLFIDAGVETYTKKTFSPERYHIWTMQSAFHNLPTVNNQMQKDGERYGAVNTTTLFSEDLCEIQSDIAPAYPPESNLSGYVRKITLIKGKGIQIHDSFSFHCDTLDSGIKNTVTLNFMTYEKPVLQKNTDTTLLQIGDDAFLCISGGSFLKTESIPITDERLKAAWEHEIYRTMICAENTDITIQIS